MLKHEYAIHAQRDLTKIAEYTREKFGIEQLARYKSGIQAGIETICQFPKIGRECPNVRINLRRFPVRQHVNYYRIYKNYIRIERILNMNQDPLHQFSEG